MLPNADSVLPSRFVRLRACPDRADVVIAAAQLPPANPHDVGERRAAAREADATGRAADPGHPDLPNSEAGATRQEQGLDVERKSLDVARGNTVLAATSLNSLKPHCVSLMPRRATS